MRDAARIRERTPATDHAFDLMLTAIEGEREFPTGTRFIPTDTPWFRSDLNLWKDRPTVFVNGDGSWLYWRAA